MAMIHPFQDSGELASHSLVQAKAEHLRELVGGEAEQSEVAGALEELVDGKVSSEDEVPTVLDLLQGVMATEIDGFSVFLGKLRSQQPSPVIELFANELGAETVGRGLQGFLIGHPEKGIVVFTKLHAGALQFTFDEVMAIEIVGDGKRQERSHA